MRTRLAPAGEGLEVLIYTRDQKDLFCRVCGYFESRRLSILDAKIHTTRHSYALDTFLVSDNGRGGHFRSLQQQVETELTGLGFGHGGTAGVAARAHFAPLAALPDRALRASATR